MKKFLIVIILAFFLLINTQAQQCAAGYKHFSNTNFRFGEVIPVYGIIFDFNTTRIIPESMGCIEEISTFLSKWPRVIIEIGVHTDYRGNSEYNDTLSLKRAQSIKFVMVYHFHSHPMQITVKGYGETEPIWTEEEIEALTDKKLQEELRATNRRVEVKIIEIK